MRRLTIYFLATVLFSITIPAPVSCADSYKLSMLPRYSTEEINARIVPLAKYLSKKTGLKITPTLTSTFDQYTKQLLNGSIDIGYQNPFIYVLASDAHEVMAMAIKGKDHDKFRGIIITAANSSLNTVNDLKGKRISIVGYTSAGGYLSQKLTLKENGIDVEKDCTLEEAQENKQENVLFSVFTGDVDAGFIRESALHKADAFVPPSAIKVLQGTAWLPNWALSIRKSMPSENKMKIIAAIQELQSTSAILKALGIKAFKTAQDNEYNIVRKAVGLVDSDKIEKGQ
jgi:phosphonate transport system substrate-binding protein